MHKKQAMVPVVLVAALFAALARYPSAREASGVAQPPVTPSSSTATLDGPSVSHSSSHASATRGDAAPSVPRLRSDDDRLDTLDVLAESLGVDTSTEGLKRRATWYLRNLASRDRHAHEGWARSAAFLDVLLQLPLRDTDPPGLEAARAAARRLREGGHVTVESAMPAAPAAPVAPAAPAAEDVAAVGSFLTRYFDDDALQLDKPPDAAKLLAADFDSIDRRPLELEVLYRAAAEQQVRVSFLIATLPDPIDSFTGWQFDPMLDAITQAIAANDYLLDRFYFPDAAGHAGAGTPSPGGAVRAHELAPSVIVFRRTLDNASERLVLLVVHENPTAGVHDRSLANAIRVILRWNDTSADTLRSRTVLPRADRPRIRVLGPTFSGSSDAVRRALTSVRRQILDRYEIRFVSGSATDSQNKATVESAIADHVTFQATVHPDTALFPNVIREIERAGWARPIAVLFEANTQYGREMRKVLLRSSSPALDTGPMIQLPFPMNISRLRALAQPEKLGLASSLGLPSRFRPLTLMEGPGNPTDQIPQFYPKTTATYVELALAGLLETMRRENVRTVALMATDPRDKLFLAQQIARHAPDVSIFTAESDSLYVHPDYSSYLQGAFVVSTYPLYSGNQLWSYGFQGRTERHQFANGSAQGIYNAALALLDYNEHGLPLDRAGRPLPATARGDDYPPRLLEYGLPGTDCKNDCQPPIWISVVGRRSAWPMRAYPQTATTTAMRGAVPYVFTVRAPTRHSLPSIFPSPIFSALLIVITFATLGYWSGVTARSARAAIARRAASRLPSPPPPTTTTTATPAPTATPARGLALPALALNGRHEDARASGYRLVCLLGLFLIALFIGALCFMRWRVEQSFWPAVALGAAVFSLAALCDLTLRVLVRIVSSDHRATWARLTHVDLRSPSTWGAAGVLIAGLWAVWNLAVYVVTHAREDVPDVTGFVARSVDIGSGVSPTVPVLCLGSALTLWGITELVRVRSARVALAEPAMRPIVLQAIHGDVDELTARWDLLNRSVLAVPPPLLALAVLAFAATCVFAFDPFFAPLVTIEGLHFGRFVSTALLLVQVTLSLALLQFVCLWSGLRQLLRRMAWHELAPAYDRVPRELYPSGLFPRVPRLMELQAPVATAHARADGAELEEVFQGEMTRTPDAPWSTSVTWSRIVTPELAGVLSPPPANRERDTLLAIAMTFIVRDALARLGHNLWFISGGVLLVFCSHTLFPFQAKQQLGLLGWTYIGLVFATILTVLVQMKRNEVLGRLAASKPGERSMWDSELILKIAIFGLVPLLTLFAAQFPDAGGMLLQWLEPVQKALP